jgi:tetratricopeptide (TPR) repeat protein
MPLVLLPLLLWLAADNTAEGIKALDAKDYPAAAEWFKKGVAEDPKDYAAHFHLALAYSLMAKDADAIAEYRTVLELKPGLYRPLRSQPQPWHPSSGTKAGRGRHSSAHRRGRTEAEGIPPSPVPRRRLARGRRSR